MNEVTRILAAIEAGDPQATSQLLPLVYDELRRMAAIRLANEKPGQTLDATALVHEAYLRLVGDGQRQNWDRRGHFFAAAAEAMRRILVEKARKKRGPRRGGGWRRVPADLDRFCALDPQIDLVDLDDALARLAVESPVRAELVKLRFFAGMTVAEAAHVLGISVATAERYWTYARARLYADLSDAGQAPDSAE
jgi:RNA polymerase sigma factor (TIGR02999 family)